jgi:phenylpropionate dioxygenase-like ring-hydroxylating dioxygenase large terminal subunit
MGATPKHVLLAIVCVVTIISRLSSGFRYPSLFPARARVGTARIGGSALSASQLEVPVPADSEDNPALKCETGAWFPILTTGIADPALPFQIEVAGQKLVVWMNPQTNEWSVMKDYCPHRLAPLSQGRVDEKTGCIECPYHGWQFNNEGTCTKIPQLEDTRTIPSVSNAAALPTHVSGNLLWAFVDLPPGEASYFPNVPESYFPEFADDSKEWMVRDLPYSYDFLLENFMDAAHIPYAHHTLQASRNDGSPIEQTVLTEPTDSTKCEVAFVDKINGRKRRGVVSLTAPNLYHYRETNEDGSFKTYGLLAAVVPVNPGTCRIFFYLGRLNRPKWLPIWLVHALQNRFLDSDVWVHDQERIQVGDHGDSQDVENRRLLHYSM